MDLLTLDQYFGGRIDKYPTECSPQIEENGRRTVTLLNLFYSEAQRFGWTPEINDEADSDFLGTVLDSGWRPPSVNACTNGAAPNSLHMTAEAGDTRDRSRWLKTWCMSPEGQYTLEQIGLWMEAPSATPEWLHLQIRPPKSGHRVFYP